MIHCHLCDTFWYCSGNRLIIVWLTRQSQSHYLSGVFCVFYTRSAASALVWYWSTSCTRSPEQDLSFRKQRRMLARLKSLILNSGHVWSPPEQMLPVLRDEMLTIDNFWIIRTCSFSISNVVTELIQGIHNDTESFPFIMAFEVLDVLEYKDGRFAMMIRATSRDTWVSHSEPCSWPSEFFADTCKAKGLTRKPASRTSRLGIHLSIWA